MRLLLNGEDHELSAPAPVTVAALLRDLGLSGPVAVEVNREIVPRAEHGAHVLVEGDAVEVVHLVGGG
ncbi:MAG: sulfur carrier protein ThiS [Polyangiaceae bacterium]